MEIKLERDVPASSGGVTIAGLDRVLSRHRQMLATTIDYYQGIYRTLPAVHPLMRLVDALYPFRGQWTEEDLRHYWDLIEDNEQDYSARLRWVSSVQQGRRVSPSHLLGKSVNEWWVIANADIPTSALVSHWHRFSPVQFLKHPKTHLNCNYYLLGDPSLDSGDAVIAVNIPLLAIQFAGWSRLQPPDRKPADLMAPFLTQFVLPKSLASFQDIAWLNVVRACFYDRPIVEPADTHIFQHLTWWSESLYYTNVALQVYLRKRMPFISFLRWFPAITQESLFDVLRLPSIHLSRYVVNSYLFARFEILEWLLDWDDAIGGKRQTDVLRDLHRELKSYVLDKTLQVMNPQDDRLGYEQRLVALRDGFSRR